MIIVKIIGGLGNQLFQYSLGRNLAIKKNTELKLDISGFKDYKLHAYSLNHFNITENIASKKEIARLKKYQNKPGKIWFFYNRLIADKKRYFQERQSHFDNKVFDISNDCYVDGYYQSEKYFKEIEDIIRQDIAVKTEIQGIDDEMATKIQSVNAISIHIRRGDYASDTETTSYHGLCSLEYYKKAIRMISEKVSNPHFFVFSDDHEWVKKNIILSYPTTYVDHNGPDKNYGDLRLMSLCKHFIIANSSFSWWGAWLAKNPNKIVIGPKKWFNNVKPNIKTNDVIPEAWIKI